MRSRAKSEPAIAVPPLVGREAELRRLLAAVDRAREGRGGAVLLAGEAGIGKTRLATETLSVAVARGFLVLRGAAFPFGGDLPYAPFLEAIGPHLTGLPAPRRVALTAGLADLGRLFPGLDPGGVLPGLDPDLERTRLLEAVARLVGRMAAERPVALLVDDLHWADTASLDLFAYLSRGLSGQAVLLLGAYRVDGARERPQLRTLVRSLRRQGAGDQVDVPALTADEVAALARALLGSVPPADVVSTLDHRAGGSPLFVTELVGSLVQSGALRRAGRGWVLTTEGLAGVPPVLRDLVLARLDRLDPAAREWLEWVAVAGDAANLPLLALATGRSTGELVALVSPLHEAGLLVEEASDGDVGYRTSHPMVAEVTYAEMPEALRRFRHAAFADALAEHRPEDLERRAHHYRGAGPPADPERAHAVLAVLTAAGTRALAMHAGGTAAAHLEAAVRIAGRVRPERVPDLLELLGDARSRTGRTEAAAEAWRSAADAHAGVGNARAVARVRRRLATAAWNAGAFDDAAAEIAAGLAALSGARTADGAAEPDAAADLAELLELRILRVHHLSRRGDVDMMTREADDLVRVAETVGSARAVGASRLARASVASMTGRWEELRHHAEQAVAAAEHAGLPLLAAVAHRVLAVAAFSVGDVEAADPHLVADRAAADATGVPALAVSPLLMLLLRAMTDDDWEAGLRAADSLVALGHRAGVARALAGAYGFEAMVLGFRGRFDEADARLADGEAAFSHGTDVDRHVAVTMEAVGAWVALAKGDHERGLHLATAASRIAGQLPGLTLAARGKAEIILGHTAAAHGTVRELLTIGGAWPEAVAARLTGGLYVAAGDLEGALVHLASAVAAFDALGMPFKAAAARLDWAQAAIGAGRPSGVGAELRRALPAFDLRDARPYASRGRALLRELGERPAVPARAPSDGAPSRRELSDRELEVVRLVAAGLSNTEIAGRLFISPRTVTTHLQHVYARLDISSRTGLVRWTIDRGLLGGPD